MTSEHERYPLSEDRHLGFIDCCRARRNRSDTCKRRKVQSQSQFANEKSLNATYSVPHLPISEGKVAVIVPVSSLSASGCTSDSSASFVEDRVQLSFSNPSILLLLGLSGLSTEDS